MTDKIVFAAGCFSAFLSVMAGAFGAHALKNKLAPEFLVIFETAVRYQMFHALALLATAWAVTQFHPAMARSAAWFFILGSLIFSGSLYVLVFTGVKTWGAVTPIGGLLLLTGWLMLLLSALRR